MQPISPEVIFPVQLTPETSLLADKLELYMRRSSPRWATFDLWWAPPELIHVRTSAKGRGAELLGSQPRCYSTDLRS